MSEFPKPEPFWHVVALFIIIAFFLVGVGIALSGVYTRTLVPFIPLFYSLPAVFGALAAIRMLRMHFISRAFIKENAEMPVSISIDGESGYAMITRLDGSLTSLLIPEEILAAGPHAVTEFVVDATADAFPDD